MFDSFLRPLLVCSLRIHTQESVFAIFQLMSIYQWAEISNRVGRKPVVLLGTVGIALSTVYLGFSRTLTSILFARALGTYF